jgi:proteic killer suppression protein
MIITFNHKGLEGFFVKGSYKAIPVQYAARIERILDRLDAIVVPEDINLPGYKFHELKVNARAFTLFLFQVTGALPFDLMAIM